ncbi:uncharacterized protein RAG0_02970 [Rhynchosporium agropyri]|uniref:Protein kinase domain-containing protein n=1 Tax=Rhynchosporium agropyri TaxID=914238 RepID=A0A1E1K366_9HELO|nr:uncharacterized protein RAG0_02970 [Rhynchosporium agropyri]
MDELLVSTKRESGVKRILLVFLRNPWNDYIAIRYIGQNIIARQKNSYFKLVNIRQCHRNILKESCILSTLEHPNIAKFYAVYCDGAKASLITENLDICITQLELQKYEIEEWEMATILLEVLKGVSYLESVGISCKEISKENIWMSVGGAIKIVMTSICEYHEYRGSTDVILDFPIFAELFEEMILSSYHLVCSRNKWSAEALRFLSCTLSGSLGSLRNVLTCLARLSGLCSTYNEISCTDSICPGGTNLMLLVRCPFPDVITREKSGSFATLQWLIDLTMGFDIETSFLRVVGFPCSSAQPQSQLYAFPDSWKVENVVMFQSSNAIVASVYYPLIRGINTGHSQ